MINILHRFFKWWMFHCDMGWPKGTSNATLAFQQHETIIDAIYIYIERESIDLVYDGIW